MGIQYAALGIKENVKRYPMKKQLLLMCILATNLCSITAQTSIQLTFTAELNGNHQPLDSVVIENLTQGGDTTLYGTDTLLVLEQGIGINDRISNPGNGMILYPPYPNPVTHTSTIRLWLPQPGPVSLRAINLQGMEVATYRSTLNAGEHSFTFYPGNERYYLVVVESEERQLVQKLINLSSAKGNCKLLYNGYQPKQAGMKISASGLPWYPGDDMRFTGYAQSGLDVIEDSPQHSTHYTFQCVPSLYPPGTVHCSPANPTAVIDVFNPITGRTWMDRNLGASQVADSSADASSYGDFYQWGRFADGHQCRTSPTTSALSNSNTPGHNSFIQAPNSPFDWRSPQNGNQWQASNGFNDPCPIGYRLPTVAEWDKERLSWSSNNGAGAHNSPLKLPMAGYRFYYNGSILAVGNFGHYWSGTVSGNRSWRIHFYSSFSTTAIRYRAEGFSVRCIKKEQ